VAERLSETKARQVYLVLRDRILSGAVAPGVKLPNENELARFHRVSRVTVRRALAELARERLIERRRSSGTRVTYRPSFPPMTVDIADALASIADMGKRTTSNLLAFDYVAPAAPIADALGLTANETVQRSVRMRAIDGMPFSYLMTHVPARIGTAYTKHELAARPLLALLERSGVTIDHASQHISAVLATPETARALKVRVGSPLIELVRVVYDREGRGVEHLHALYRPDRYRLEIRLARCGKANARTWSPIGRARTSGKVIEADA
jgi:GntR family transcriptional regulator